MIAPEPMVIRLADVRDRAPYFGESFVIPQGRWPLHRHDHCEILIVTRGSGTLEVVPADRGARAYPLRPGFVTLIRPSDRLRHTTADPAGVSTLYVSFAESDWWTFATFMGVAPSSLTTDDPPTADVDPNDAGIAGLFETAIGRLADGSTLIDLARFWLGILPILFPSVAVPSRYGLEPPPFWLSRSIEAMRAEENLRAGLPRLLELSHVSSSYLAMTTRRHLSTTPRALVMELRLRHAALLLATTSDSVRSIADRCGIENFPYFSTSFRRAYHLTPRDYRARYRREPMSG